MTLVSLLRWEPGTRGSQAINAHVLIAVSQSAGHTALEEPNTGVTRPQAAGGGTVSPGERWGATRDKGRGRCIWQHQHPSAAERRNGALLNVCEQTGNLRRNVTGQPTRCPQFTVLYTGCGFQLCSKGPVWGRGGGGPTAGAGRASASWCTTVPGLLAESLAMVVLNKYLLKQNTGEALNSDP